MPHEETTMPDLFDVLSIIAAKRFAEERTARHEPPEAAEEHVVAAGPRPTEQARTRPGSRGTVSRRSKLLGWSR
jgi:hypothetical protein